MQIKLVEWFRLPNYSKIQYTYDHLERISGMAVMSNSENFTYAGSTYEYSAGNGSNTTSDTVEKLTLRMTNTQFSYVYDDCNNITEIYKNNSLIRKYSYDDLQQMTKEVIIEPEATTGTQYDINSKNVASINPIRYRGYYYDIEKGMYYLNSRYYWPKVGRFISLDTIEVLNATPTGLTDKNLYAYCDNNPVVRVDSDGEFWETVFDVISLGASIVEVCVTPTDPWAWAGLVGDVVDLVPFVTGVGEVTRVVKTIDKVSDTVEIAKAVDFTDDVADVVKTLDRSSGFTKSTASIGQQIHKGYKATSDFPALGKEFRGIKGIRPDYIDFNTKTIYELKPMNPRGIKSGVNQLRKYDKILGGGFRLRLELY